ncbi:MAG: hypothetical protein NUV70_08445 [Caldiserica bacterium]|jgi:hypothetical protein|nr:hypothetical protein [Caldisericota bacterium]
MSEKEFHAAKIIRFGNAFYLMEVDDHNRHVGEIAKTLGASEAGCAAALCHDLGKIGNLERAFAGRKPRIARDYLQAYVDWIVKQAGLDKQLKGSTRQHFVLALLCRTRQERYMAVKTALSDISILDDRLQELIDLPVSPFPRHADGIPETVLGRSVKNDYLAQAGCPYELIDYAFELIRLHHSFRVDRIVEAASALEARLPNASAQQFVQDLHTLISADNVASGLYEKALSATNGTFSFGNPAQESFLLHDLEGAGKVEWLSSSGELRCCRMHLEWQASSCPKELYLDVTFHVVEVG